MNLPGNSACSIFCASACPGSTAASPCSARTSPMPTRRAIAAQDLKPLDFNAAAAATPSDAAVLARARGHQSAAHRDRSTVATRQLQRNRRSPTPRPIRPAIRFRWKQEMIKVADTQAQYQAAANLYAKAMGHDAHRHRPSVATEGGAHDGSWQRRWRSPPPACAPSPTACASSRRTSPMRIRPRRRPAAIPIAARCRR